MASCTLLLLLASFSGALASHYYGGTMTFTPKGRNNDGSFRVDIRYKQTFDSCYLWNSWFCRGNCGRQSRFVSDVVDQGNSGVSYYGGRRCQTEILITRDTPTNKPFEMTIPQNCPRTLNLLAHDPDGDKVRCRYGNAHSDECYYCHHHSGFVVDQNTCTVSYSYTHIQNAHAFEMVLEDYPKQQITLSYTDGTWSIRSPLLTRRKWAWYYTSAVAPTTQLWGHQPHSTPSPHWRHQPHSTPSPHWGHQPHTTPAPYWGHHPHTTPAPYWGHQPHSTPSPYWGHQPHSTPSPHWGHQPHTTPAPYWGHQPHTTPAPYWGHQPHSTPSPWSWNQPNTSPAPYWWNQPVTISPTQGGQLSSATASAWLGWYTSPPHNHLQATSTPPHYPWWGWLQTTTEAITPTPSRLAWWQRPTTTTPVPSTSSLAHSAGPLSKIPLHFAFQIDPAVNSCIEGVILPQFLPPTPRNGEFLDAAVNQELEIRLKATATQTWVNNFIISGPLNITKYNTNNGSVGESLVRWTPTENDLGDHVPICFIAESQSGSRFFHSEMRCIIVIVGHTYGTANVVCNETTMTVAVEKASIIGLHEDHLRLMDPSCTPISNGTHVIATMSLSSCGTQLEEDADNLIFKNEITSYDKLGDVITRKHQVEIGFSCIYPRKDRVSLEFMAHKIPYVFTEKGFGQFTYEFEFFHSSSFNSIVDPHSYPVEVDLKEMLYMEIKATSSIANTELFVESCTATPVDDPNYHIFYEIITDGCVVDETVVIYPSNASESKFGIEAFKFIGQHEEVYMSCVVILCVAGEPNSRCSQGCLDVTPTIPVGHHHRRRAAPTETARHYISQGPLRLKKSADLTVSSTGLSMNLVFIAAVLLVAVIIVCGAVIYTAKRPKIKYQPLPSTDF